MSPVPLRQSPLALFVGVIVFVGLLTWLVGWALPLVIFLILLMVMGHEFGHFITAKRSGLLVSDFFVGFGPILWSTQRGETRYGIRALPLGGYVKVPGMTWGTPVPPEEEARTYREATYPKKVLFASAGSLMHVVMALALAWVALTFIGTPSATHVGVQAFTPWQGHKENAAQIAGLHVGDQIVKVDGTKITSIDQLTNILHGSAGKHLTLVVERAGRDLTLHATPVNGRTIKEDGQRLPAHGYIGIEVADLAVHTSPFAAIPDSFSQVGRYVGDAVVAIGRLPGEFPSLFHQVTNAKAASNPVNQDTRPSSIVGVARIATQAANTSPLDLITILVAINIFIGVLNMLPMLPLDGGYVAIATYERLRTRRGKVSYHADINKLAPVVYAFMSALLVLFACTLYLDIAHPIANPF
ncbi:MAG: M50 family metallopeptidase [Acidimicrobiales bacterium]|jgi:membrane-associated protease RseP (regulator of RpoE activity)